MNDDVALVDQHPIALLQAFDAQMPIAGALERLINLFSQRRYVTIRPTGRNHHIIGDGRFAMQRNGDDLLALGRIQRGKNDLQFLIRA